MRLCRVPATRRGDLRGLDVPGEGRAIRHQFPCGGAAGERSQALRAMKGGADGTRPRVQGFAGQPTLPECYHKEYQHESATSRTEMLISRVRKRRKALYISSTPSPIIEFRRLRGVGLEPDGAEVVARGQADVSVQ